MAKQKLHPTVSKPKGVQHDSETPLRKKPSLLFIVSTSIGVLVILLLTFSAYYGMAH